MRKIYLTVQIMIVHQMCKVYGITVYTACVIGSLDAIYTALHTCMHARLCRQVCHMYTVHITALSLISIINKCLSMDGLRLNFLSKDLNLADLTSLSILC